jgi:hypothetical protein
MKVYKVEGISHFRPTGLPDTVEVTELEMAEVDYIRVSRGDTALPAALIRNKLPGVTLRESQGIVEWLRWSAVGHERMNFTMTEALDAAYFETKTDHDDMAEAWKRTHGDVDWEVL